jgi:hypothetical protein
VGVRPRRLAEADEPVAMGENAEVGVVLHGLVTSV